MAAPAYASGGGDQPLLNQTIPDNLAATVRAQSGRSVGIVPPGYSTSYDEFHQAVRRCATGLLARGLGKGDRLGLWSPNYAEWVIVQYATAEIGVILVNINPAYRTHELAYALNQSGCKALIAAPSFGSSDYQAMVADVQDEVSTLEWTIFFWTSDWDELLAGDDALVAQSAQIRASLTPDDPINIQYTSGTTGFPKGATLSHRNILNNGYFVASLQALQPGDRMCIPVPFYHCFGMVMGNLGCTSHGLTMVIPNDSFKPDLVLKAVAEECCQSLYGVPTMFIGELALADFEDYDLSSLRTGVMAGSPCPVEVMKQCIERMHMRDVTICYGMTETSPVSTQTLPDDS